jgi:hypothetical protein
LRISGASFSANNLNSLMIVKLSWRKSIMIHDATYISAGTI